MRWASDDDAVRWTPDGGLPTRLGELDGGSSPAQGLNEAGRAVGWSTIDETTPSGTPIRHAARFPAPDASTAACARR